MQHRCEFGTIDYNLPNIPQGMRMLSWMGLNSANIQNQDEIANNEFLYLSRVVEKMGELIGKIDINIDGEVITDYDSLLAKAEMVGPLSTIARHLMGFFSEGNSKKKPSLPTE